MSLCARENVKTDSRELPCQGRGRVGRGFFYFRGRHQQKLVPGTRTARRNLDHPRDVSFLLAINRGVQVLKEAHARLEGHKSYETTHGSQNKQKILRVKKHGRVAPYASTAPEFSVLGLL